MVRDVMHRDFAVATAEESIASARQTMRLARLRHLPVTRDGVLVGIISYRDLLERLIGADDAFDAGAARVADLMQAPTTIGPDASLAEAADPMCRYGFGCLPVVNEGGRLVGLVTERDLLRAAFGARTPA